MSDDPMSRAHQEIEWLQYEVRKLRKERDGARREVCLLEADTAEDQIEYARQRGWDCFKEDK